MSTLYENEYQVHSVITRYHREATEANQLSRADGRQGDLITSAARHLMQTFRTLVHRVKAPARHVSMPVMKSGPPVTFLHFPE